jgi:plastocyanin
MRTSTGRVQTIAIIAWLFIAITRVHATTYYVNVYPNSFSPATLNIGIGDTVTWVDQDPTFAHSVTSTTGAWSPGYLLKYQDTFALTFNGVGTNFYYDQFDNFVANIVVTSHLTAQSYDKDFVIADDTSCLYQTALGADGINAWNMGVRTNQVLPFNSPSGVAVAIVPDDQYVYGSSGDPAGSLIRCFNRVTGAVVASYDTASGGRPAGSICDRSLLVTPNHRIFYSRNTRLLGLLGAVSLSTNIPATVEPIDAGANRTVSPGEVFTLLARATNATGSDTFSWSKISGTGTVNFSSPTSTNTTVQINTNGNYVLEIARSNSVGVSRDRINVTVSHPITLIKLRFPPDTFNSNSVATPARMKCSGLPISKNGCH